LSTIDYLAMDRLTLAERPPADEDRVDESAIMSPTGRSAGEAERSLVLSILRLPLRLMRQYRAGLGLEITCRFCGAGHERPGTDLRFFGW
jgi:hypothetical protein